MDISQSAGSSAAPTQSAAVLAEQQRALVNAILQTHNDLLNQAKDIQAEGNVASIPTGLGEPATEHGNDQPSDANIRYIHVIKSLYINLSRLQCKDINEHRRAVAEAQTLIETETEEHKTWHTEAHKQFLAFFEQIRARNAARVRAFAAAHAQQSSNQAPTLALPQHVVHRPAGSGLEDRETLKARFVACADQYAKTAEAEAVRQNQAEVEAERQPFPGPQSDQHDLALLPIALMLTGAKFVDPKAEDAARAEVQRLALKYKRDAENKAAAGAEIQYIAAKAKLVAVEEAESLKEIIEAHRQEQGQCGANRQYPGQNINIQAFAEASARGKTQRQALWIAGGEDKDENEMLLTAVNKRLSETKYLADEIKYIADAEAECLRQQQNRPRKSFAERTTERANAFINDPEGQKKRIDEVIQENNRLLQRAIEIQAEGQAGPFRWPDKSNDDECASAIKNGVESSLEYKQIVGRLWENFTEIGKVANREGVSLNVKPEQK